MRRHITEVPARARLVVTKLVIVPTHKFGRKAETLGLIHEDETWAATDQIQLVRGARYGHFITWRYLDSLDQPPPVGSSVDVVEAWLAREETPFPPLDLVAQMALNGMVLAGQKLP